MTTVCVSTHDLRRACTAVVPHAHPRLDTLRRVRLEIGKHNITLTATDGWTSGLAIASVWESEHDILPIPDDGVLVDLAPDQVRKILSVFKAPADKTDEPEARLQIEVGDNYVKIADVSGLPGIDGQALELPRIETLESFSDVAHTISRIRSLPYTEQDTLHLTPRVVAAFTAAAQAYGAPIQLTAHAESRTLSVVIGESFLGLLTPHQVTDEERERANQWADSWDIRLPAPDSLPRNATKADSTSNAIAEGVAALVSAGVTSVTFTRKDGQILTDFAETTTQSTSKEQNR